MDKDKASLVANKIFSLEDPPKEGSREASVSYRDLLMAEESDYAEYFDGVEPSMTAPPK